MQTLPRPQAPIDRKVKAGKQGTRRLIVRLQVASGPQRQANRARPRRRMPAGANRCGGDRCDVNQVAQIQTLNRKLIDYINT